MTILKKYWPSILPILTLLFTALTPMIQAEISAHPAVAAAVAGAYAVLAHLMPSPTQKP
jgi:hypothetical protein